MFLDSGRERRGEERRGEAKSVSSKSAAARKLCARGAARLVVSYRYRNAFNLNI
jgi:hypothetical protein